MNNPPIQALPRSAEIVAAAKVPAESLPSNSFRRHDLDALRASSGGEESRPADVWLAVYQGNADAVEKFLDAEDIDIDAIGPDGNATMIASAAFLGHENVVEMLIRRGADVNRRNVDRGTPLHAAAFLGQWESVRLLIENGADLSAQNRDGATPLQVAKVD